MTNAKFLSSIDERTREGILRNIAGHYQISTDAALAAVTDPQAEHLLEYLTGSVRGATHVLMKREGFA